MAFFVENTVESHLKKWYYNNTNIKLFSKRMNFLSYYSFGGGRLERNFSKQSDKYTMNEWEVEEQKFLARHNHRNETIFSTGNGFIGMRGNFEEGMFGNIVDSVEGTYVNGFFECNKINYNVNAFGYAEHSQTMLNVTNGKVIRLVVEDEEFNMLSGTVKNYHRSLNFKKGILNRSLIWTSKKGHAVSINIDRLVSFTNKNLVAIRYEVTPLNFSGVVKLISEIRGDVKNQLTNRSSKPEGENLYVDKRKVVGNSAVMLQKTTNSKLSIACAIENVLDTDCIYCMESRTNNYSIAIEYNMKATPSNKIILYKYIAYEDSRNIDESDLAYCTKNIVNLAKDKGFEYYAKKQREFLRKFWQSSDIEIKGNPSLQQAIRFNIFQVLQSVGRDGKTNIPSKGLTGEGYEGNYFWDTEIYVIPFLVYNNPEICRKLLEFRYSILDKARKRARELSHKSGALFPSRTINGEECSKYYPTGTAQYHVNADIAFAIKKYMDATEDKEFLIKYGAEILFETARLWIDLGEYVERRQGKFCINSVTGPDEYTTIIDNNYYTNIMAKENLIYAHEIYLCIKEDFKEEAEVLFNKINLTENEVQEWEKAADNMYFPKDKVDNLFPQDDSFLTKPKWNFENTPKENYPLISYYHPLVIYRHQVCKQADLLLSMFLLKNKFSFEEKKVNYDYYEKITTHDSSLSQSIFSIIASQINNYDDAYKFFVNSVTMDLEDLQGNEIEGVHIANMAGSCEAIISGFAGMYAENGQLSFKTHLPIEIDEYSFKITYRARLIKIKVNKSGTTLELLKGETIKVNLNNEEIILKEVNNEDPSLNKEYIRFEAMNLC